MVGRAAVAVELDGAELGADVEQGARLALAVHFHGTAGDLGGDGAEAVLERRRLLVPPADEYEHADEGEPDEELGHAAMRRRSGG